MNVYFPAGLKELAQASGFRGETLTSIQRCSNFNRTHHFLLQSWEALYRHFIQVYVSAGPDREHVSLSDILSAAKVRLSECNKDCQESMSFEPFKEYLIDFRTGHPNLHENFLEWVEDMTKKDPNWCFWRNFVLRDAFAYISVFLSIRGGLWKLRLGGIKLLAPLFAAFDRPHYQKLIPQHLKDIASMPQKVIEYFENGSFVCIISGSHMRSVALDEAHEMLVNKDLKTTIVRPSKEYLDRILYYYPVRSLALKTLKEQLFLDSNKLVKKSVSDHSPHTFKVEENVMSMRHKLSTVALLLTSPHNTHLQSLSGVVATPEQE